MENPHPLPVPGMKTLILALVVLAGWLTFNSPFSQGAQPKEKLLILIEGAGDFTALSRALEREFNLRPEKLEVQRFHWSHGYLRVLADQTDLAHLSDQGMRLAAMIRQVRARNPQKELVVLAHSAGCAVALAGISLLNDDMVSKVVLLAPSVGKDFPLIPALASSKNGIHVFYSEVDTFVLGPVIRVSKTADNARSVEAAGRYGFKPLARNAAESLLIGQRLRQVKWAPKDSDLGNQGGHYGAYANPYLGKVVLPILMGEEPAVMVQTNTP